MTTTRASLAAESRETAGLQQRYRMFVDGKLTDGSGEPLSTVNPATGEGLAEVSTASTAEVDTAVRAARRAYDKVWSRMPGVERAKYLFRIARLLQQRAGEFAVLESLDSGMPIRQTRDAVVPAAAAHFFHHAGWADKLDYAGYGPGPRPVGVIGQVISSGAGLDSAAMRIAPALACGNTVVLKPGEATPLSALALAGLCQQADLPPGVVNVLPGGDEVGAALVTHRGLAAVTFTGSVEVGKRVQQALAGTGRRLSLALSSPGSLVVFDDVPVDDVSVDETADGIVADSLAGAPFPGGGCRLLVSEPIAERLLAALRARAQTLRVGDPLDGDTDVGAITSWDRLIRVRELADSADAAGARRWTSPAPLPEQGFFFAPTIFSGVGPTMRVGREEIGGPVLPVFTFGTPEEAVSLANNTPVAGFARIWTDRASRLRWVAQRIRARVVCANSAGRIDPAKPWEGPRAAGPGREGGRGELETYLDV